MPKAHGIGRAPTRPARPHRSCSCASSAPRSASAPVDLVLEPSAGTGLLAIHAELAGGSLVLNEIADTRADLLERLFPTVGVTRYDAAHIHDHLDAAVCPTV